MKMKEILQVKGDNIITINKNATVHEAIQLLNIHQIGALLVLDSYKNLSGIITERDILRECETRSELLSKTLVKDLMTTDVISGTEDDKLEDIMSIMTLNRIRHIPIIKYERIIGLISIGDIVKAELKEIETENRELKEYIYERY